MRWRLAVFGTLGALATAVGGALVLAPRLVLSVTPVERAVTRLAGLDPNLVLLAATLVVGLYVALAARATTTERAFTPVSDAQRRYDRASTDPPEAVTADRRTLAAAGLDADIDAAVGRGGDRLQSVRQVLADLAAETYADRRRVTVADAREAVAAGAWTDDAVAAAFLGGEDGPTPSLLSRLRLWLTPERERARRIDRTLTAIETLAEAEP